MKTLRWRPRDTGADYYTDIFFNIRVGCINRGDNGNCVALVRTFNQHTLEIGEWQVVGESCSLTYPEAMALVETTVRMIS